MTKITITWQEDADRDKPYNEHVEPVSEEALVNDSTVKKTLETLILSVEHPALPDKLEKINRAAVIVVLDDCIEQLSIMKCLINEPSHSSWNDLFQYQTLQERFTLFTPKKKQQFCEEEYEKIIYTDSQKLQKDICFLISTLKKGCAEIQDVGVYTSIVKVLLAVRKENEDDEQVELQCIENETEIKQLKKKLITEKNDYLQKIEETRHVIGKLKVEIEDVYAYGKEELRYTNDWETTRGHQHEFLLNEKEDVYNNTITKHLVKIDYENRIHNETENFIEENTEDLQNSIQYWMQQYDEEVERRDSDIIKLKMIWEQLTEDHNGLKAIYEEHKAFVEERRAINEERRKQEELLRLQTWAAIKIQAWWRGTMVRKKLGPFKKKKKGKDKKGDKGGKKKK